MLAEEREPDFINPRILTERTKIPMGVTQRQKHHWQPRPLQAMHSEEGRGEEVLFGAALLGRT